MTSLAAPVAYGCSVFPVSFGLFFLDAVLLGFRVGVERRVAGDRDLLAALSIERRLRCDFASRASFSSSLSDSEDEVSEGLFLEKALEGRLRSLGSVARLVDGAPAKWLSSERMPSSSCLSPRLGVG